MERRETLQQTVLMTEDLTKAYNGFVAVDGLDLTVRQGEVFGLLGPNGAGKTTTILMILGLTEPTSGTVRVLGFDPEREPLSVKARVGYLPERLGFYDGLTAYENLAFTAKLNGLSRDEAGARIEAALSEMGLGEAAHQVVGTFSRGMRQRLGVADVLLKQPQLIIMDEPTQGLDPQAAREFLDIIRRFKSEGITVVLASHLLHQVQAVCDRVGLFHRGHMVLEGTVRELAREVLGGAYRIRLEVEPSASSPSTRAQGTEPADLGGLREALGRLDGVLRVSSGERNRFELEAQSDLRPEAARAVVEAGGRLLSIDVEAPGLDEIYAHYFEREEVEHGAAVRGT
ncbi:MAG: ABC transporter ATP-binding protein [Chloroflexota bacterium]